MERLTVGRKFYKMNKERLQNVYVYMARLSAGRKFYKMNKEMLNKLYKINIERLPAGHNFFK